MNYTTAIAMLGSRRAAAIVRPAVYAYLPFQYVFTSFISSPPLMLGPNERPLILRLPP